MCVFLKGCRRKSLGFPDVGSDLLISVNPLEHVWSGVGCTCFHSELDTSCAVINTLTYFLLNLPNTSVLIPSRETEIPNY